MAETNPVRRPLVPRASGEGSRVSDIAATFERRRPMSGRMSDELNKSDSPVGAARPVSGRLSGEQLVFATNGADSPKPEPRRTLKSYRSSDMQQPAVEGSQSPKVEQVRRQLKSYRSSDMQQPAEGSQSPKVEQVRRQLKSYKSGELTARGSGLDRASSQRFGAAPSPRERVGSQRGIALLVEAQQSREMVRVVSQRALTTQIAKSYLQTIEQQKLQSDKAYQRKKEEEEEEAMWIAKKKTARRLLGSFSMYDVPGFSEVDLSELESESMPSSPSSQIPDTPPSTKGRSQPSLSLDINLGNLDDEYEKEIEALLRRRVLSRSMMMWRAVAAKRADVRKRKEKVYKLPNIVFGRRRSKRMPAPKAKFAPRRTSRLSVIRRPTSEDPLLESIPQEWFDLGNNNGAAGKPDHKHQLNLGRRSIKPRESVSGTPPKQFRLRRSTAQGTGIRESDLLTLEEEGISTSGKPIKFADIPENKELDMTSPTKLPIVVSPPPGSGNINGKGLTRTVSWSQKGMGVIKSMFSGPSQRILARVPSKEKLVEHTPQKDRMVAD